MSGRMLPPAANVPWVVNEHDLDLGFRQSQPSIPDMGPPSDGPPGDPPPIALSDEERAAYPRPAAEPDVCRGCGRSAVELRLRESEIVALRARVSELEAMMEAAAE